MTIPQSTIELIRQKASIEDIVKRYVPTLTKRGKNYVGLCPFHKETSPSFTVSPDKQLFYCFGCHVGGNVFTFISKIERVDFKESVKIVGEIVGIPVKEEVAQNNEYDVLLNINSIICQCYRECLLSPHNERAMNYLLQRGVSRSSIEEFQLGYAPDTWDYLVQYLRKKNVSLDKAAKTGNINKVVKNNTSHYYDRFRDRIIFPIFNQKNEIVGFGGRIIESGEPKYLNSPESLLFQKRHILYGLHKARPHIAELGRAIVVEGYLDVIGVYQSGIYNVVAPLGTALTLEQLQILSRLCNEVIIVFDADSAGIKASLRSLDIAENINVNIKIAQLPEQDPFEFIARHGVKEFMAIVDAALSPVDFRIERILSDTKGNPSLEKIRQIFTVLKSIPSEIQRQQYIKDLAFRLHISEKAMRADYERFIRDNRVATISSINNRKDFDFCSKSERELVLLLCNYPHLIEHAIIDCPIEIFTDPVAKNVYQCILDLYENNETITLQRLFDYFPEGDETQLLNQGFSKQYTFEDPTVAYSEIIINMRIYAIDKKIEEFAQKIENGEDGNIQYYMTELEVLRREREKLTSYVYNKSTINNKI